MKSVYKIHHEKMCFEKVTNFIEQYLGKFQFLFLAYGLK